MPKIFVLDTNVLLHDHKAIRHFQDNNLVIPIAVIEEIDKFKKGNDALAFNARGFMRDLDRITEGRSFGKEGIRISKNLGFIKVEPNHPFSPEYADLFRDDIQDPRILSTAMWVRDNNPGTFVALVTKDVNLRMKAKAAGMEVQDYLTDKVEEDRIENAQKEVQTMTLPSEILQQLAYGPETAIDWKSVQKGRPRANQLYKFNWESGNGDVITARFDEDRDKVVLVKSKEAYGIRPRNDEQKMALDACLNPKVELVSLTGGAGTGKSALGRAIAAVFGLPLEIYTCSSTDTKDDLAGTILPYVDEEKAEGLSSPEKKALEAFWKSEGSGIDAVAKALNMPNTAQCKFDPEGVYEDVLGAAPSGEIDSSDAYRILVDEITGRLKSITKKAGASGSGVRYKAMKTAIIRAIENGRLLLLEEVACVKDQGAFMFLSDIFEKEGIGVVNTIYGDIHRHPGFILVGTTNRKYKGLKPINEATRSRFQYFVKMDTPSTETIMERVGRKCGITDNVLLRNIAEVFQTCESKGAELNADGVATLRGLFSFADAVKRGKDPKAAFENYLLYAITTDPDDASEILQEVEDCEIFNV